MLKGIDHRLNADVLHCLRAMGHGDVVVVCDANFPADSVARATVTGRLLRMEGPIVTGAVEAILSVLPLDTFVPDFAVRMEVVGEPAATILPIQTEVQGAIDAADGREARMVSLERFAFYDHARAAYAVIQTGERRFYGCFAFRKGVIGPEG